jgi:hypothetical protein
LGKLQLFQQLISPDNHGIRIATIITIILTGGLRSKPKKLRGEDHEMVAYEFYWLDETEKAHFIGILPERREDPERITPQSILNWGKMIIGKDSEVKDLYYVKVEI